MGSQKQFFLISYDAKTLSIQRQIERDTFFILHFWINRNSTHGQKKIGLIEEEHIQTYSNHNKLRLT